MSGGSVGFTASRGGTVHMYCTQLQYWHVRYLIVEHLAKKLSTFTMRVDCFVILLVDFKLKCQSIERVKKMKEERGD